MPPGSFSYPTPFEFNDPQPSSAAKEEQQKQKLISQQQQQQQEKPPQHDVSEESPSSRERRPRGLSRGGSMVIRSKSNDEAFLRNMQRKTRGVDTADGTRLKNRRTSDVIRQQQPSQQLRPPSPVVKKRCSPLRSKSSDEIFGPPETVMDQEKETGGQESSSSAAAIPGSNNSAATKPRPTLPKTKSGRFLPKPVMTRSRPPGSSSSNTGSFIRRPPGKTQSAGSTLESMRQSTKQQSLPPACSPSSKKGGFTVKLSSFMPPVSPNSSKGRQAMPPIPTSPTSKRRLMMPPIPASPTSKGRIMMPPRRSASPGGSTGRMPASPSRKKVWLISPGNKKKKAASLQASSGLGSFPAVTPTKHQKTSLSQSIHTGSPSDQNLREDEKQERSNDPTPGNSKKSGSKKSSSNKSSKKTFQQLLAIKKNKEQQNNRSKDNKNSSSSKNHPLEGITITVATRERSISPVTVLRSTISPTIATTSSQSMGQLPFVNLVEDDDGDDVSLDDPQPTLSSATGIVAGLWNSFNGSFRRDGDDSDDDIHHQHYRGRSMDSRSRTNSFIDDDDQSLSSMDVDNKAPASTSGLITGFIDKMYDSFMNDDYEDDEENAGHDSDDEYHYAFMHNSVSKLDQRINALAGLQ